MHINVNTRIPLARVCESDFVVPILVDIIAPAPFETEDTVDGLPAEYVVGRVWAERLDWSLAETMGYTPVVICDEVSATWLAVYETLCNKKGSDFRKDLQLDNYVSDIVFVHEILLHPDISDRVAVFDAVLNGISSENSLMLKHYDHGLGHQLGDSELRDLGFKKIARSSLLLRDNHFRYPFYDANLGGREVDFCATAEHEEWLIERWDNLIADHPGI